MAGLTYSETRKTTFIIKCFRDRGGNALSNTEKRVKAINEAIPLTQDHSVILPHKLLVVALCKQILTLIDNIRIYDKQISQLFNCMPDAELFNSLPGTGLCLAPCLLAAQGEDRSRFNSAQGDTKLRGTIACNRTKRSKELGSLALAMLKVYKTKLYRMVCKKCEAILLGWLVL